MLFLVAFTAKVKAFYKDLDNQHYAINVVKRNIDTTEKIQDDVGSNIFTLIVRWDVALAQ